MNFANDESGAVLAKSLILIEKTKSAITRLDQWRFPTDSSGDARKLLLNALDKLCDPVTLGPIDPAVLQNRLFSIQELAELVQRSTTDHISWPLVSYCDHIWATFFGADKAKIFYSVTSEHNYSILPFSQQLAEYLSGLLPSVEITALTAGSELYCLQLASSEDENLPLYAIIGHEFGHAVFDHRRPSLLQELDDKLRAILPSVFSDLAQMDAHKCTARYRRIMFAIGGIAEELFCDLVGAVLMGPAFFLSLYEMAWGQTKSVCRIRLSPNEHNIIAYPSFHFRLHCIRSILKIDEFCKTASHDFNTLSAPMQALSGCLATVPVSHLNDSVKVLPVSDDDAAIIESILTKYAAQMKPALEAYLGACHTLMMTWYPQSAVAIGTDEIGQLLHRLDNDILPNIIPTDSLLGEPATFAAILNACALFRLHLLTTGRVDTAQDMFRRTGKVERLTAKAFEVSFIQKEFNKWQGVV